MCLCFYVTYLFTDLFLSFWRNFIAVGSTHTYTHQTNGEQSHSSGERHENAFCLPMIVELKNAWRFTSTFHTSLHDVLRHRETCVIMHLFSMWYSIFLTKKVEVMEKHKNCTIEMYGGQRSKALTLFDSILEWTDDIDAYSMALETWHASQREMNTFLQLLSFRLDDTRDIQHDACAMCHNCPSRFFKRRTGRRKEMDDFQR
jgi:hypothetical protein